MRGVNYKAYDDLTSCLASLSAHRHPDDEVVVAHQLLPRQLVLTPQPGPSCGCAANSRSAGKSAADGPQIGQRNAATD